MPSAAGLKNIALASSYEAADPANAEPIPLADCSISEKPAAFATDESPQRTEVTVTARIRATVAPNLSQASLLASYEWFGAPTVPLLEASTHGDAVRARLIRQEAHARAPAALSIQR